MTRDELARVLDEGLMRVTVEVDFRFHIVSQRSHPDGEFVMFTDYQEIATACRDLLREVDEARRVIATAERMAAAGVFPELIEVGQDAGRFVIHFEPATHESYAAAVTAWGEQNPEVTP